MDDSADNQRRSASSVRLLLELGRGGMGIVYLAVAQGPAGFAKLKVIKRLRPDFASDKRALEMFLDEARTSARLLHPNIVQTNEVGFDGKHYFLEMEYLEGQSYEALTRKAAENGGLPLALSLWILAQTLGGLHYAHESTDLEGKPLKVVHRDVSPHNVFVTYDGNVKVLDFGIAKAADSSSETQTGVVKGKATYMAPEQTTRKKGVDHRADIFAVGVMLWQAITGTRLWGELTDFEIFMRLQTEPIPSPRTVQADVPGDLEAICMRALAIDPNDRFATAADFQTAIEEHLEATGIRKGFNSSQRELAKTMTALFATQRAEAKAEIEAEMKKEAKDARTGVDLPRLGDRESERAIDDTKSAASTTTDSMRVRQGTASLKKTALLAVGAALVASAAVILVSNRAKSRAATAGDAGASAAAIVKECNTNAECMHSHANAPWICRKDDWKCAALESADCKVMAEPGDVENDRTIWIGAMLPTTGPHAPLGGLAAMHAVDLVRREFVQMTHGIPPISGDTAPRPLAVVACDDSKDSLRIAHHLVDDVGVPAVIGFSSSQEVIDLATSVFIPKRVLMLASMNSSALITAIPHPVGMPRLVWRSTLSTADVAVPVSVIVSDLFEPRIHAAQSPARPIRLALLRRGNTVGQSLAGSLLDRVHFNGKTIVENGENFHEFVVKDSAGEAELRESAKAILEFRPQIILCDPDELTEPVLVQVETGWPAEESFKPYTLFPEGLPFGKALVKLLRTNKERRARFLGLGTPSTTSANARLKMRFNEVFTDKVTLDSSPAESYDGTYLLAYAAYLAGEKLTGPDLARAMARLVPPGKSIDVGPLQIFEAVEALRKGENIDLNGAMTPLNFDLSTGETSSSYVILCCGVNQAGGAFDPVESGMSYDTTTKKLTGSLQCP